MRLSLTVATALYAVVCANAVQAQTPWPCPRGVPADTTCTSDRDANGAYVLAAVPKNWSGVLVVHAHGGPRTTLLTPATNDEDLARFAVFVREGHAWVNSSYRRPGFGVAMAVEDTDNARRHFLEKIAPKVGAPRIVIAHGQSWGGNVAAKLMERDAERAEQAYDGALLTSAVLPGGPRGYWFRADLRAVYNYYCHNHPRPDEPPYPIATGLPAGAKVSSQDLAARIDACTGVSKPAADRTAAETQALANILGVIKIREGSLVGHMTWATSLFQDMVHELLGGLSPFSNIGVTYAGSNDDAALNAGVARFASDPAARAALDADGAVHGTFARPVLTVHAIDDPTAFVENEAAYRNVVAAIGRSDKLAQVFLDEAVHSKFSTPVYPASLNALLAWIATGRKPSPPEIAAACAPFAETYHEPCTFASGYEPRAYDTRVPARQP